jgi:azurin
MWQRWNQTTHIFEKSDNDGSSWTPLGLDAAILTEGALAKARQHTQTAYKDEANVFTLDQRVEVTRPKLIIGHPSVAARTRLMQAVSGARLDLTTNLSYDGTNWQKDDTGAASTIYVQGGGEHSWWTSPISANPATVTRLMYLGAAGNLQLDFGQLFFPATANPSANANALDDYEEGTWTPLISGTGGATGQTYSTQVGQYLKIGRQVWAAFNVQLSAKGTITGDLDIRGLPFTPENVSAANSGGAIGYWANLNTNIVFMSGFIVVNDPAMRLTAATGAQATLTAMSTANVTNTTQLVGSIWYRSGA